MDTGLGVASGVSQPAVITLRLAWPRLWPVSLRGLILEGSNVLEGRGGNPTPAWIGAARTMGPECLRGVLPRHPLSEQWPWGGRHWGPPRGCLLFGAALSALGRTAVVADEAAEAHSHGRVTAVHGDHSHLLFRRSMGQAQAADVGLWGEETRPGQSPQPLHPPPGLGGRRTRRVRCPRPRVKQSPSQLCWANSKAPKLTPFPEA